MALGVMDAAKDLGLELNYIVSIRSLMNQNKSSDIDFYRFTK